MKNNYKISLSLILILGAVLRFFNLGVRPFDGDEGIMVLIANNNWQELFARASQDVHPPLYHLLLKIFIGVGINEFSVRLLSAIAGVILIYLIFIFAKKLLPASPTGGSEKIALIAAGLAAISPYLIYPSQEARMYALFAVFALLSYYFFYNLISQKPTAKSVMGYILFSAAAFYTQYLGFVIVGSQFLYLLYCRRDKLKEYKTWIFSYFVMFLLFIPQIKTMLAQFSARTSEQAQLGGLVENIKGLIGALYRFGAGRLFLDINPESLKTLLSSNPFGFIFFILSLIIPLILFIAGCAYLYRKNRQIWWFLIFPLMIGILLALISREVGSRASRYFIYLYPMYLLFLAQGIIVCWRGWKKIIPVLLIIIFIAGLWTYYNRDTKSPGADAIAKFLQANCQENDAVLFRGGFGGGEKWALQYYLNRFKISDLRFQIYDMYGNYTPGNLAQLKAIKPVDKIQELLSQYSRVFFYDMTYQTSSLPNAKSNFLGYDKENKQLIIWEVNR